MRCAAHARCCAALARHANTLRMRERALRPLAAPRCAVPSTPSRARAALRSPRAPQVADIDEKAIRREVPEELVMALAHAKAAAIRARLSAAAPKPASPDGARALPALLITSDQVVVHNGLILEKPEGAEQARAFIRGYGASPARTCGAICVTNLASGAVAAALDSAVVHFTPIPEATVEALVAEGDVFFCAGGLMVEHPLVACHVAKMEGGMDSIMGLGQALTAQLLLQAAGESGDDAE
jgi:septum formation protein